MKINEKYFYRVKGNWDWTVHIRLNSFKGLICSSMNLIYKIQIILMIVTQKFFGQFKMTSKVDFENNLQFVVHSLYITKWGILFYKSIKQIKLDKNGFDLYLEGDEYIWPFLKSPKKFKNYTARVNENYTSAKYEWPLFGLKAQAETLLNKDEGIIYTNLGWLSCSFNLTHHSMLELNKR